MVERISSDEVIDWDDDAQPLPRRSVWQQLIERARQSRGQFLAGVGNTALRETFDRIGSHLEGDEVFVRGSGEAANLTPPPHLEDGNIGDQIEGI